MYKVKASEHRQAGGWDVGGFPRKGSVRTPRGRADPPARPTSVGAQRRVGAGPGASPPSGSPAAEGPGPAHHFMWPSFETIFFFCNFPSHY